MRTETNVVLMAFAALALSVPTLAQINHDKIVSCYYSSWAFYRPGIGKFDVTDIDPFLCTHGFYAFADMSNETWQIKPYDPWFDLDPTDCNPGYCKYNGYRRFTALKEINPNFVPMLSVGGWNAGSKKFSEMAKDPAKRKTFVDSVVPFLKEYGFEGIDFDWEYPGNRDGDPNIDKEDFNLVARDLKEALEPEGLLVTAALGCGYDKIIVAYDMPALSQYLDFYNLMAYDFNGMWDNFTGHNAPLYRRPEANHETHPRYAYNTYDAVEVFLEVGALPEKMVLGMPTYGRGFTLADESSNGIFCDATDGIPMGHITRTQGMLGYMEVLEIFSNDSYPNMPDAVPGKWTTVIDDCYKAPYITQGKYWLSYDDEESLAYKVRYLNLKKLAGAMIWSVETDDFGGFYSNETYPLLRKVNEELAAGMFYDPAQNPDCGTAPLCELPPIDPTMSPQ